MIAWTLAWNHCGLRWTPSCESALVAIGWIAGAMPYWSIYCLYCGGYIADALLECVPAAKQLLLAYHQLFLAQPGAALACPYCNDSRARRKQDGRFSAMVGRNWS
jgi:hypothetical protein